MESADENDEFVLAGRGRRGARAVRALPPGGHPAVRCPSRRGQRPQRRALGERRAGDRVPARRRAERTHLGPGRPRPRPAGRRRRPPRPRPVGLAPRPGLLAVAQRRGDPGGSRRTRVPSGGAGRHVPRWSHRHPRRATAPGCRPRAGRRRRDPRRLGPDRGHGSASAGDHRTDRGSGQLRQSRGDGRPCGAGVAPQACRGGPARRRPQLAPAAGRAVGLAVRHHRPSRGRARGLRAALGRRRGPRVPAVLVRGGDSAFVADADEQEFLRRHPTARSRTVPGAGHSVQSDRPAELAGIIDRFVAGAG